MATTTNYGWTTPDDTGLVKDGASNIRTLGSSIDTTTKALNPSTTLGDIEYRSSTANTNTRLAIGTTGQVLSVSGGVPAWTTVAGAPTYAIFRDSKDINTEGGTFTSGAWRTRDINNTQFNGITGASIASNQITLAAGSYYVNATLPVYQVNGNQGRFQNITDSTTTILGNSVYSGTGAGITATVQGYFTITGTKVFEVQHRSQASQATIGFGVNNTFNDNIYSIVTIIKVA